MNKVICDICGTTYPEAAEQCPICGCARPEKTSVLADDGISAENSGGYTYVRGGRFSNANVRKRNQAKPVPQTHAPRRDANNTQQRPHHENAREHNREESQEKLPSNRGLVVLLIVLILAIIGVACYIYFSFFAPQGDANVPENTTDAPVSTTGEYLEPEPELIPCIGIQVSSNQIELNASGSEWLLNAVAEPVDTTDDIYYTSSDESVAMVSGEGRVTAVGSGTATITVSCGDQVVECVVTCVIETTPPTEQPEEPDVTEAPEVPDEPEEPEEPEVPEVPEEPEDPEEEEPADDWSLNRTDITFRKAGEKWTLYEGSVSKALITFSSDDESIATFKNGVVTAVGNGTTVVRAKYNGKSYYCTIRVKLPTE